MTVNDLVLIESGKVRSSPDLMRFYIESFKEVMGYAPNCAGCTFSNDWRKFQLAVNGNKKLTIKSKTTMGTFKLKRVQNKILSYKANGRTYRSYDNTMNIDFVNGYLSNGSAEEIKQRKELFSVLPDQFTAKQKPVDKPIYKPVVEIETSEDVAVIVNDVQINDPKEVIELPKVNKKRKPRKNK